MKAVWIWDCESRNLKVTTVVAHVPSEHVKIMCRVDDADDRTGELQEVVERRRCFPFLVANDRVGLRENRPLCLELICLPKLRQEARDFFLLLGREHS